jgi:ribosomal protein L29
MDYNELTTKTLAELQVLLAGKRETLRDLRFKVSENQQANVREIRKARNIVARIMTAIEKKNKENN